MQTREVASNLCNYDTRNPDGVISYYTAEQIKEEDLTEKTKPGCYCDNCFTGRAKLAEHILKLQDQLFQWQLAQLKTNL